MALGFCPAILRHIEEIAGENAPSRKMQIAGFLSMLLCCQNSSVSPINDGYQNGHSRTLTVRYSRRPVISDVQDEENCDINTMPGYLEWTLPGLLHRQISFGIEYDTVRQYCEDASAMRSAGAPATRVMQEVWDRIVEHINTLLRSINTALVTQQATEFGRNVDTNSYTKFINISSNGDSFILDNGMIDMMHDFRKNQFCGDPCIVGAGIYSAYDQAHAMQCCRAAGIDMSRMSVPRFFYDDTTETIWGQNSIGAFAPGSVKFISFLQNVGNFGGAMATSQFAVIPFPVEEFGCADDCLRDLMVDMQVKEFDCPTEVSPGQFMNRGVQVILSKKFSLWTQPDNAYQAGDPLFGTNGTLKYFISNTAYSGGSYAYAGGL